MLIHIKVIPESKKESVVQKNNTSYIIKVKDPAERNAANIKIISLLAEHLKIDRSKIRIIGGHHTPSKIIDLLD